MELESIIGACSLIGSLLCYMFWIYLVVMIADKRIKKALKEHGIEKLV